MSEPMQTETQPPGADPDPPFWFWLVQVWTFWDSPMDCSSALVTSEKVTLSTISMSPLMAKCLVLVPVEADASSAALQEQHWPSQVFREAVLGI